MCSNESIMERGQWWQASATPGETATEQAVARAKSKHTSMRDKASCITHTRYYYDCNNWPAPPIISSCTNSHW